jgi:hypothetical protein
MRKLLLTLAAATAVLVTGSLAPISANAATPIDPTGIRLALDDMKLTENVAWCFYPDGWNGPGMYRCGWHKRHGQGWHGPRESRRDSHRDWR